MLINFTLGLTFLNKSKLITLPDNSAKSLPSRGAPLSVQCKSSPGVNKLYATKASSSPKVLATKRIKEVSKCTDLVV